MYQRILVPIDGSSTSLRALQEAIKLANGKAQLRLVYVLEEVYLLDPQGYEYIDYAALREAVRQTGERALAQAADIVRNSQVPPETSLLEAAGRLVCAVINEEAKRWHADLIVIGTHGRTGLSHLMLGSIAEGVVREASVPVLMIRAE